MKFAAYLLIFIALFALTFAADFDCEIGDAKLKKGDTHHPEGKCEEITCQGPNSITLKICPSLVATAECELIPQDNSKTYPECCGRVKCEAAKTLK